MRSALVKMRSPHKAGLFSRHCNDKGAHMLIFKIVYGIFTLLFFTAAMTVIEGAPGRE